MMSRSTAATAAWLALAAHGPAAFPAASAVLFPLAHPSAVAQDAGASVTVNEEGFAARAVGEVAGPGGLLEGDAGIVTFEDLNTLLIWRDGKGPNGDAALRQLLELRVIRAKGRAEGIEITEAMLDDRYRELDVEAKAAGSAGGLKEFIASQGVELEQFREYLELSMIHETLTRRALGIPAGGEVSGDQQQIWLEQELKDRGFEPREHPWDEGVVCISGDVVITRKEFGDHLRSQVDDADEREACYLILLERAVRARMPEVTAEGANKALDREIERRAAEASANPDYQGVAYDRLLEARGLSIEALRLDPAIRAAALAHEAVDRRHDDESLRKVYEEERDFFDSRFGEAVELSVLFKNATEEEDNPLVPSFRKVERELREMKAAIAGPEDFARVVEIHSQDKSTRERGGLLGQITRAGSSKELADLRSAAFAVVDATPDDIAGTIIGPIRIENGVLLGMLGARTPAPTWPEMRDHVHRELRGRFLNETLDRRSVATYLDPR
ncbi:peptidylprolyl isomerase [Planctomycetes bacterium Poly30]